MHQPQRTSGSYSQARVYPARRCSACAACCHSYIPDGTACEDCVKEECSGAALFKPEIRPATNWPQSNWPVEPVLIAIQQAQAVSIEGLELTQGNRLSPGQLAGGITMTASIVNITNCD